MKVVHIHQCIQEKEYYIEEMKKNKLFVYPTDSLYGIGSLFSHNNLKKISSIKHRGTEKKMNIIAPSFERIFDTFTVHNKDFLLQCFDAYHATTFILEPKENTSSVNLYTTEYDNNTIGVRVIKHPFQDMITSLGKPFISTSANVAGQNNIINIHELHKDISNNIDYIIDGGSVLGIPSVLIFDKTKDILHRN